jgi:hypothetical protein
MELSAGKAIGLYILTFVFLKAKHLRGLRR